MKTIPLQWQLRLIMHGVPTLDEQPEGPPLHFCSDQCRQSSGRPGRRILQMRGTPPAAVCAGCNRRLFSNEAELDASADVLETQVNTALVTAGANNGVRYATVYATVVGAVCASFNIPGYLQTLCLISSGLLVTILMTRRGYGELAELEREVERIDYLSDYGPWARKGSHANKDCIVHPHGSPGPRADQQGA